MSTRSIRLLLVSCITTAVMAGGATAMPASAATALLDSPATAISAQQAPSDGTCELGELCLHYFSNLQGSMADFSSSDANLSNNRFVSPGAGRFRVVTNNSESYNNRNLGRGVTVWTGANFTGAPYYIDPGQSGNFGWQFRNNVESLEFD